MSPVSAAAPNSPVNFSPRRSVSVPVQHGVVSPVLSEESNAFVVYLEKQFSSDNELLFKVIEQWFRRLYSIRFPFRAGYMQGLLTVIEQRNLTHLLAALRTKAKGLVFAQIAAEKPVNDKGCWCLTKHLTLNPLKYFGLRVIGKRTKTHDECSKAGQSAVK